MNSKQAKAEPLPDVLGKLGYLPASVRGDDIWYRSPFRPNERTPSFKIDRQRNVWFDHGIGEGGTIIDFFGALHGTTDVSKILTLIAETLGNPVPVPLHLPAISSIPKASPVIERVGVITDRGLETYLETRGIPLDLARLYLKEVDYRVGAHGFRALGFGNDAGGFEVRSPTFKGSIGKKDITTVLRAGSTNVALFEGFFDFLSLLTHYQRDHASGNVLVLNSLSLMPRGIERMDAIGTRHIHAYLDHDPAGARALATLQARAPWQVTDASILYADYKDANAFIA